MSKMPDINSEDFQEYLEWLQKNNKKIKNRIIRWLKARKQKRERLAYLVRFQEGLNNCTKITFVGMGRYDYSSSWDDVAIYFNDTDPTLSRIAGMVSIWCEKDLEKNIYNKLEDITIKGKSLNVDNASEALTKWFEHHSKNNLNSVEIFFDL